jgi:hypothetical protein
MKDLTNLYKLSTKHCLVCLKVTEKVRNETLYWHVDKDISNSKGLGIWCWCNRCERAYSIEDYTRRAGLSLAEFLKQDFNFKEASPNEVQKIEWPKSFIPLFDSRAEKGVRYLKSRGIDLDDNMFYDLTREGIVFPYHFDTVFCGAQIRLIEPWKYNDGNERKIDTLPGTRVGLLFYNWNQQPFAPNIKAVIITEGAFNTLSIQQALNNMYGSHIKNPFKCIALSGSSVTKHHLEVLNQLKKDGYKIICAPDSDEAGFKMLKKFIDNDALTHFVLTNDPKKDWNDIADSMTKEEFAKWFLGNVQNVKRKS